MRRRDLLLAALAANGPGFELVDVTREAGIAFSHNTGAYGAKLLPETLGSGCAFVDYDNDGWLDILLLNGRDWPGHQRRRSTMRLYRNNRNGTFSDVTRAAGLDIDVYAMGVAVGDFDNDGFADLYITAVGQNLLLKNNGRGGFIDVTRKAGLAPRTGLSTSALWFDYDRDGLLDLFVCNYVRWNAKQDVFCSLDGKTKSYCTPEAYRGTSCWLFRNRGNGTFEDVTAAAGVFDPSSKSLGVAMLDMDRDGWPDLFVANDTQPNKLYRNNRDGTFNENAVRLGAAFSEDGRARAGMGVDVADLDGSGAPAIAVTNFDNEMMGLYRWTGSTFADRAMMSGVGAASRDRLGFGCFFFDADLDGRLDLLAVNGHIDETVRTLGRGVPHAQAPHLFLNDGGGKFRDVAMLSGPGFAAPKVARGAAFGDFDRDGDMDVLVTTNGGPVHLYRMDGRNGNRSIRFRLQGVKSNRDAIGAVVRIFDAAGSQSAMVRGGSSYLSASDRSVTFGVGKGDRVERAVIYWPSGQMQEFKSLATGRSYRCVEGKKLEEMQGR